MNLTVFVGNEPPFPVDLNDYGKETIRFGRSRENDIVLQSQIVSGYHGCFQKEGGVWFVLDNNSTNGILVNENPVSHRLLSEGLKLYIGSENHSERVVFLVSEKASDAMYRHFLLSEYTDVRIGRKEDCEILLEHVGVSRVHAQIIRKEDGYYIKPVEGSEIRYNGRMLPASGIKLSNMDRFMIADTLFLYRADELIYSRYKEGLGLEVSHLSKKVRVQKGKKTIINDVSLQILPGEFVAIIGGSGAGKSSVLKCISGCSRFDEGQVLIQGEDIRMGYEGLKRLIGYVPQQDVVHDSLTLEKMLYYSAYLRMPKDSGAQDIKARIRVVLEAVELTGHENTMIRSLSGGQKKRASIAVELLSDPGIFFLDEPTSGLDPGTEKSLMCTLKKMTEQGKTIILVTHTPLNLHLCDRIIVMGFGGRICYCGKPEEAIEFFGVPELVDIYNLVNQEAEAWNSRYKAVQSTFPQAVQTAAPQRKKNNVPLFRQLKILSVRYLEMMRNDAKKLFMQILMPFILGFLLFIAFSSSLRPFVLGPDTQTFSLALACCCFWMGLFQSIQEICKERTIVEREKMAGMAGGVYLASKIFVLGVILMLQCTVLLGFTWFTVGHPAKGIFIQGASFLEYLFTTYLTALSASMLGFLISACVKNTDQAVSAAPLLLIPQILFSGIIAQLSGAAELLSWLVGCNWCCLAYGTLADINTLPVKIASAGERAELYQNTRYLIEENHNPALFSWAALFGLIVLLAAGSYIAVKKRQEL